MKSFIVCFVLATVVVNMVHAGTKNWTKEELEKLKKISLECQKISKVTDDEIKDIREKDKVSNSPEMKKHLGCSAKHFGIVKDNGEIDKELLCKKLELTNPKDKADKIVKECAVQKSNANETSHHLIKCVIGKDPNFKPTGEPKS